MIKKEFGQEKDQDERWFVVWDDTASSTSCILHVATILGDAAEQCFDFYYENFRSVN